MQKTRFGKLLQKTGKAASDVARETGISTGLLSYYKHGTKMPSAANVKKIADYFGVSTDYLLRRDENAPPGSAGAAHSSYWIFKSLEFLPYLPRRKSTSSRPMRGTALLSRIDTTSA